MALSLNIITLLVSVVLLKLAYVQSSLELTTTIGDKKYYISLVAKVTWSSALHTCRAKGMSLASIESVTEQTNLKNYLSSNDALTNEYWLSGSDLATASVYTWLSTGNAINNVNWASGQPDPTASFCVFTDSSFKLTTIACTDTTPATKYFICSQPTVPECGIFGKCSYNYNG